ncbi:hypothetical protein ACFFRR_003943 [Megaselia abdita]
MASSKSVQYFIGFIVLAALTQIKGSNALQCWTCSSETIGAENFCGEIFREQNIPEDIKKRNYLDVTKVCNKTGIHSDFIIPVCRKTVEENILDGKITVKRFCYFTNKSDSLDQCKMDTIDQGVKRTFCQDCTTDRCNTASEIFTSILLVPLVLIKLLFI